MIDRRSCKSDQAFLQLHGNLRCTGDSLRCVYIYIHVLFCFCLESDLFFGNYLTKRLESFSSVINTMGKKLPLYVCEHQY